MAQSPGPGYTVKAIEPVAIGSDVQARVSPWRRAR